MVESLRDVLAKCVACTSGRDPPTSPGKQESKAKAFERSNKRIYNRLVTITEFALVKL